MLYLERSAYDAKTRGMILADLSPIARYAVKLYFRCQMFKEIALPEDGGVLDQSEMVVSMLETVHGYVLEIRNDEMEKIHRGNNPPPNIPGVDPKLTENISIGKNYRRTNSK